MRKFLTAALVLAAGMAHAEGFSVKLALPWNGVTVPEGQQCRLFGGDGATPVFVLNGLPEGTTQVRVEFNDKSYPPLSEDGGHGVIGFPVSGPDAVLPSVPGMMAYLPSGATVISAARTGGRYASAGYLPPCSGGRGNRYEADVVALDARGAELARVAVELGRY